MSNKSTFGDIVAKMMESVTLDDEQQLQITDEAGLAEAEELISTMILEKARNWWEQFESKEESLADMADEITFGEMNADPSHVATPDLAEPTMESLLGSEEESLDDIFEMLGEDDDDLGMTDGDEDYDDMMIGQDENGIGDDAPIDDGAGLDIGDDEMDSLGGDEFGAEDDMDDMDDDGEFDFSFLNDEEFGADDEFGADEFGAEEDEFAEMGHMHESDDEEDEDCDDEDGDDE